MASRPEPSSKLRGRAHNTNAWPTNRHWGRLRCHTHGHRHGNARRRRRWEQRGRRDHTSLPSTPGAPMSPTGHRRRRRVERHPTWRLRRPPARARAGQHRTKDPRRLWGQGSMNTIPEMDDDWLVHLPQLHHRDRRRQRRPSLTSIPERQPISVSLKRKKKRKKRRAEKYV